jgi:hypothetical protein
MMGIETYRDKCVEQSLVIDELYERIYNLKDKLYKQEDVLEKIVQELLHSHITLGEMERIGGLYE